MGNCISWDRNKSIWALRILSEVLLCTGIVSCVAAFTIEVRLLINCVGGLITNPPTLAISTDHPYNTLKFENSFKRKTFNRY